MSQWEDNAMDEKIRTVLNVDSHQPLHHFGRPFMTAYQIALRVNQLFPEAVAALGMPIGGRGTGQHNSLAQYIALELSKRIHDNRITDIEGRFLYREFLQELKYDDGNDEYVASSGQAYDLSIYRLQ